jgi:hypothetical protein
MVDIERIEDKEEDRTTGPHVGFGHHFKKTVSRE